MTGSKGQKKTAKDRRAQWRAGTLMESRGGGDRASLVKTDARMTRPLPFTLTNPKSRMVRLVYPYWSTITEGAADAGAYKFYRLNSAYDVDTTVGSTTVPGFNEWATFFINYRVWRTRVRIEAAVTGGSAASMATVCLVPNANLATLPATSNTWPVQSMAVHRTIVPQSNGGRNTAVLTREFDIAQLCQITRSQFLTDMDFTASVAANPARQSYVAVTVSGVNSSTPVTLTYQIYVSMLIEFFNPVLFNA